MAFIISTHNLSIFLALAEQATDYKSAAAGGQITIKHVLQILHHLIEKKLSLDVKNKESSLWKHKCY